MAGGMEDIIKISRYFFHSTKHVITFDENMIQSIDDNNFIIILEVGAKITESSDKTIQIFSIPVRLSKT